MYVKPIRGWFDDVMLLGSISLSLVAVLIFFVTYRTTASYDGGAVCDCVFPPQRTAIDFSDNK